MQKHFTISLPLVRIDCRDNFEFAYRQGCPLKNYIDSEESVYAAWPHEKRLLPDTNNFEEAYEEITKIRNICEECKKQPKIR